jgi:DNA recombination protein RmuC
MILESVLEKAGLVKGQHFHTQVSATSSEGRRLQPDVVLDLPG